MSVPTLDTMHFFWPKTTAALLVFILWANVSVSGFFTRSNAQALPAGNNDPDTQTPVPSGWRKIDAYGKFSFYLPPNMWDTGIRGIENLHGEYTNGRLHLSFDYEPFGYLAYSNRALAFKKGFQEIELSIDGRKAFLFLHQNLDRKKRRTYNAQLYVGNLPNGDVILSMLISSRSARYMETAKTIFQTIKFAGGPSN